MCASPKKTVVGVPGESSREERRVALTPECVGALARAGAEVVVSAGAGRAAGFLDKAYRQAGAQVVGQAADVFAAANLLLCVRPPEPWWLEALGPGQVVVGMLDPLGSPERIVHLARRGVTAFALELLPRIARAQSMDALSSMATIAGYKAILLAAETLPRMFPMMITAAGTVAPVRVFVLGAGVAGLQAIATARRLGAVVRAYDVRPSVKEQVQSVGGQFVELPLAAANAENAGGYARLLDADFYARQRERMARIVAESDVVIATAAVPGERAPVLVDRAMVERMKPGSVIVDLAAYAGGNCELTRPGETLVHRDVTVIGPLHLPATVPYHASQLYAKNVAAFVTHLLRHGRIRTDRDDEILKATVVAEGGAVVHPRVRERLGEGETAWPRAGAG